MVDEGQPAFKVRSKKPKNARVPVVQHSDGEEDGPAIVRASKSRKGALLAASSKRASLRVDPPPLRADDPAPSLYSHAALQSLKDGTPTRALLPTEAAIHAARDARVFARKAGVSQQDYVSLSDSSAVGFVAKKGSSRLVKEDDELGDAEDVHAEFTGASDRIALDKKGRKAVEAARKQGIKDLIDAQEDNSDEEAQAWEWAQIQRGAASRHKETPAPKSYRPATIPTQTALPSLPPVNDRLSLQLDAFKSSHTANLAVLDSCTATVESLNQQEASLRASLQHLTHRLSWAQELDSWVADMVSFLDVKLPLLDKIEKDNIAIQSERRDMVWKRRRIDDADDLSLATGAQVPISDDPVEPMEEDDLGRIRPEDDLDPASSSRQYRRSSRLQRTSSLPPADQLTDDILSSSDQQDLQSAAQSLSSSLQSIFSDVASQEFRDPVVGVLKRFLDWKSRYPEEFAMAFGGLLATGACEFYGRVENADWNPLSINGLKPCSPSLENFRWHSYLSEFQHSSQTPAEDDLLTVMTTKTLLPLLSQIAQKAYDPLSPSQTSRVLQLLDEISLAVEPTSQPFFELVKSFLMPVTQLVQSYQLLLFPHLSSLRTPLHSLTPEALLARTRLLSRLVQLFTNSLRLSKYAKSPLSLPEAALQGWRHYVIQELGGKCILPLVEVSWDTGGKEEATKIRDCGREGWSDTQWRIFSA